MRASVYFCVLCVLSICTCTGVCFMCIVCRVCFFLFVSIYRCVLVGVSTCGRGLQNERGVCRCSGFRPTFSKWKSRFCFYFFWGRRWTGQPLPHVLLLILPSLSNPNQNTISSKKLPWISEWELNTPFPFAHGPGVYSLIIVPIYQSISPLSLLKGLRMAFRNIYNRINGTAHPAFYFSQACISLNTRTCNLCVCLSH